MSKSIETQIKETEADRKRAIADFDAKLTRLRADLANKQVVKPQIGDVFQAPDVAPCAIMSIYQRSISDKTYFLTGLCQDFLRSYSNGVYTYEELIDYLKSREMKKIGTIKATLTKN